MAIPLMDVTGQPLDLEGPVITVTVGSLAPATFHVHEDLICRTSDFFTAALKPHWQTSTPGVVTLKDEDPEVFKIYLHWLYRKTFPVQHDKDGDWHIEYMELAQAYLLGDMLQDDAFKDDVLEALWAKFRSGSVSVQHRFPDGPAICCIYQGTPEKSAARRLLVDIYACHAKGGWLKLTAEGEQADLPAQFILDVAVATLDKRAPCEAEHRLFGPQDHS